MREIQSGDRNYRLMRKIRAELEQALETSCTKGQMQLIDCSQ